MKRVIIAVIVFIFIQAAYAATPQLIDYQGYLMESGAAVTGTKSITFTLYDSATGGAQLCTSGAQSVAVTSGVFSYRIGSAGCNLSTINWDNPVYLELKVEGTTLSPRELVAGAAYSVQTKAMNVVFTPAGNVASTNVQSAISELDTEKLDKTGGTITGALAVTGNLNASGTVTATNLSGDGTSVTNVTPKDSSVTSAKVADNSLTAADLNVNVVSSVDGVTSDGGNIDIVAGSGITVTPDDAANTITFAADVSVVDHNSLANLTAGDPHTQYAKKAGDTLAGDLNMGTHDITNAGTVAATNLSGDGTSVTNVTPKDDSVTSAKVADNSLTAADLNVNVVSSVDGVTNDGGDVDLIAGNGITITPDDTANTITLTADVSAVDHNSLANLTAGDPHTQYAKKAGDTLTGDLNMGTHDITNAGTVTATGFSGDGTSVTNVTPKDDSVTSAKIADGAVGTSEVADGTLTAADLNVNVVSSVDGVTNDGGNIDIVAGSGITITPDDTANTITLTADVSAVDHNSLANLTAGDPHTQYAKKAGDTLTGDLNMGTHNITNAGTVTATGFSGDGTAVTNVTPKDDSVTSAKVADNSLTAVDLNVNVVSSVDGVTNDGGDIDLIAGSGVTITPDDGANTVTIAADMGSIDHGSIAGLGDDDHTQYVKDAGDTMTGTLAMSTASGDITFDNAGGNITLAGGSISDSAGNVNLNDNVYVNGNMGVGTASPKVKLDVAGNITASGTVSIGSNTGSDGYDVNFYGTSGGVTDGRMYWDASKDSFRAGRDSATNWSDANTGQYSFASGLNTKASGMGSTALGYYTTASGSSSIALGYYTTASGGSSIVLGNYATSSGNYSIAAGQWVTAGTAANTITLGQGVDNSNRIVNNTASSLMVGFNSDVATLYVGPGSGAGTYGKVGIGTSSPSTTLDVAGTVTATGGASNGVTASTTGAGPNAGVYGYTSGTSAYGVRGTNAGGSGIGVIGESTGSGSAVYGFQNSSGNVFAGNHTGGGGNLIQMQAGGVDKFTVDRSGNVTAAGTFSGAGIDAGTLDTMDSTDFVAAAGDTMTGALAMSTASGDITFDNAGGDITLAGGSISDSAGDLNLNDNVTAGSLLLPASAYSTGAPLDIGDITVDYPGDTGWPATWNSNIVLSGLNSSSIAFYDYGANLGALKYLNNNFYIGEDVGWGRSNLNVGGTIQSDVVSNGIVLGHANSGRMSLYATDSTNDVLSWSQTGFNMAWNVWEDGTSWQTNNTGASQANFRVQKAQTPAATDLAFTWMAQTSGAVPPPYLMSMLYNGNLGLGTTTPQSKFDVEGSVAIGATYSGTSAAPANGLIVEGNVGIGTSSPTSKLYVLNSATSGNATYFYNSNTGNATGKVVYALNAGGNGSRAGYFENNNAVNTACSIWANNTGGGEALCGEVNNTTSTSTAIKIGTIGDGKAASFSVTKATNTEDAVYISHDGVGSGTTAGLEVVTSNGAHAIYGHTAGATGRAGKFIIDNASNDNDVVYIETASVVGGTTLGRLIDTNKGAYLTNTGIWTDASSRQYKKDITPLTNDDVRDMLDVVKGIQVVRYRYKEEAPDTRMTLGVIAEDAPDEMTDDTKTGVQTVKAVGMLIAAMQAQQELIDGLQREVDDLKKAQNDSCVK